MFPSSFKSVWCTLAPWPVWKPLGLWKVCNSPTGRWTSGSFNYCYGCDQTSCSWAEHWVWIVSLGRGKFESTSKRLRKNHSISTAARVYPGKTQSGHVQGTRWHSEQFQDSWLRNKMCFHLTKKEPQLQLVSNISQPVPKCMFCLTLNDNKCIQWPLWCCCPQVDKVNAADFINSWDSS